MCGMMPHMSEQRPRRINVAVNDETAAALERIVEREGLSLTEAVRRLLGYGNFVYEAVKIDGAEVLRRDGSKLREIILL